jgi:hypothetical protein
MVEIAIWLTVAVVCGVVAGGAARAMGESRQTALLVAGVTAVMTAGVVFVTVIAVFAECFAENRDPPRPSSFPWSPRREYCQEGTVESAGRLAIILLPAIAMTAASFFRRRRLLPGAAVAYCVVALAPFAPALYLAALPYYEIEDTPAYFDPVLRPARGDEGPRVCMRHGVAAARSEPDDPYELRTCVELEPTNEAHALKRGYDGGQTSATLDALANDLTRHGAEEGSTDVDGLVVTDVSRLTLEEAGARKYGADGEPVLFPSDLAEDRVRAARRARHAAALMDACGRARGSYVGCDQRVQTRLSLESCGQITLRDDDCDPRRKGRYMEIAVGIDVDPEYPGSYIVSATPGGIEAVRGPGIPRNGPPQIRCLDSMSCPGPMRPAADL